MTSSTDRFELPGGRVLAVLQGDLTEERADAIVNAANSRLAHGGGVAGAIVRKGGRVIQDESDRIAPVPTGEAAATSGGRLAARHVIHAVGPVWGEGNEDSKLQSAFTSALVCAADLGCVTLSIPAVSSGIFGFPKDRCARIFLDSVLAFLEGRSDASLREIRSVNIDAPTVELFRAEARSRLRSAGPRA